MVLMAEEPVSASAVYDGTSCNDLAAENLFNQPPATPCGPRYNVPRANVSFVGTAGVRIPVMPGEPRGRPRVALLGGVELSAVLDGNTNETALAFVGGVEVVF